MKHLIKTVSFMAVMTVIPGAFAATSRASIMGQATSRLPSIAGYVNPVMILSGSGSSDSSSSSSSSSSSDASSLLTNADCIDSYTACVKGNDACGSNFEECTTNVLFHAQMPKCLSVLSQCSSSGIDDLFGTSSVTSLSDVAETNTGEVVRYTYPTDGSVLGQLILGASIANKYDAQQCVKRYTSCLKKDSVCGNDFELCTSATEFKKQSIFCASTLARCQSDGLIELFGSTNTSAAPKSDSRIGMMIAEGAELAAVNAVSTCYKVADQCILSACGTNPAKCMENTSSALAIMTDAINNGVSVTPDQLAAVASMTISNGDVNKYIRNMCQETIGGNKYCYATANDGKMPTASQLTDEDNREMVFEDVYAVRMNSAMKQRLTDMLNKFDEKTKDKCVNTIKTCAMRSCGGGVGSACYALVFADGKGSINGPNTYDDIRLGCEAITNTDPNCQYAVASTNNAGYLYTYTDNAGYSYTYTDNNTFITLFPEYDTGSDPIAVVAALNASLSSSYNDAAIAQMKKQCSNTVVSCVKSMCGKDYKNCYRNRTDIVGDTYKTESESFNRSMNKVGGVLDYTIVTGLCVNTVKNAKVCEEHLKIESVKLQKDNKKSDIWGSDVRGDWLTASSSIKATDNSVKIGCRTNTDGCDNSIIVDVDQCGSVDEDGCIYDESVNQDYVDYVNDVSATKLFQQVLIDLEKEAQAKYNAKLTKEQNICLGNNNGGIKGMTDMGSTFAWVKLKSNRVPAKYMQQGLKPNQFTTSNDLYGSFCRARITVVSDDKAINEKLGDKAVAYFAVGDAFECGSWIDSKTMEAIEKEVKSGAGVAGWKQKAAMAWSTVGGALLGGTAGGLVGNYLANGQIGGNGLLNSDAKVTANNKTNAGSCVNNLDKCLTSNDVNACRAGLRDANAAGISAQLDWAGNAQNSTVVCQLNDSNTGKWCPSAWSPDICESKEYCCTSTGNSDNPWRVNGSVQGKCQKTDGTWVLSNVVMNTVTAVATADSIDRNNIERVRKACSDKVKDNKSSATATGLGVGIGAVTGGLLGFGISKTVVDAKNAQAKDKRLAEWKAALGEHIRCYLGSEDVAGYGEYVSFNFEDMN